jgi:hypothetical protein
MEELKIKLNYNPDHFKEIYYRNGQGNIFTHKPFRNVIFIPVLLLLVTIVLYFLSFKFPQISWTIGLCLAFIFVTGIYATISIVKYMKWKKGIETNLKGLSDYKSYNLTISSGAIEFSSDSKITIDKWDNLKSVLIEDEYIFLRYENEAAYMFPAKSMSMDEYEKLKEIIKIKIKQ